MVHIALVLTRWMSDVEIHHFCLGYMHGGVGDGVKLWCLNLCCGHIWRCRTAQIHLTINEVGGKIVCYCGHTI